MELNVSFFGASVSRNFFERVSCGVGKYLQYRKRTYGDRDNSAKNIMVRTATVLCCLALLAALASTASAAVLGIDYGSEIVKASNAHAYIHAYTHA